MLELYKVDEFYPPKSGNYRFEWKENNYWRVNSKITMEWNSQQQSCGELDSERSNDAKVNGEEIDVNRMSSAYILLLLSYLRVNMNRTPDKPLCCYRPYQKISEDIGLSERYITRIAEILDLMNIIKFQEGKRIRYKKQEAKYGFLTTPKVFADYRHYTKDEKGKQIIDIDYDFRTEIQKQLDILEENQKQI